MTGQKFLRELRYTLAEMEHMVVGAGELAKAATGGLTELNPPEDTGLPPIRLSDLNNAEDQLALLDLLADTLANTLASLRKRVQASTTAR